MYNTIKKSCGRCQDILSLIKSINKKCILRKVELGGSYKTIPCFRDNRITCSDLGATKYTIKLDLEPTYQELSKAIDNLSSGKAPASDRILLDRIKLCKTCLLHLLQVVSP